MPVCPVCESEEYVVTDGLYYCKVCSTQSQEVVQEEFDDFNAMSGGRSIDKRKTLKNPSSKCDRGKPWYSVEAFQVILKAQVQALIDIGCTPMLKDVVKQIWFKYVQKSGLACIDPETFKASHQLKLKKFRDEYLEGLFDPSEKQTDGFPCQKSAIIKLRRSMTNVKGKRRMSYSSSEEETDFANHKGANDGIGPKGHENVYKSDEEWLSLASNLETSDEGESSEMQNMCTHKRYRRPFKISAPNVAVRERAKLNYLNLQKLLAIVCIALQWCKEPVTLGDLFAWIKQGYFPYLDAVSCLLPHMKLTDFDIGTFMVQSLPTYIKTIRNVEALIPYVEMPAMPNVEIRPLIARYVLQLNLPFSLNAFIKSFTQFFHYGRETLQRYNFTIYTPELVTFGLIIIALKMLFGLDDNKEWDLDRDAKSCGQITENEREEHRSETCKPFQWSSWCQYHLDRRRALLDAPKSYFDSRDVTSFNDVHSVQEHWQNVTMKTSMASKEAPVTRHRREVYQSKRWTFDKLCEAQGSAEEMERRTTERQIPHVVPRASESVDMTKNCLWHAFRHFRENDESADYVCYTDTPNRLETGFTTRELPGHSNRWVKSKQFSSKYYTSYEFVISLAEEFLCAHKSDVHGVICDVERAVVGKFLN